METKIYQNQHSHTMHVSFCFVLFIRSFHIFFFLKPTKDDYIVCNKETKNCFLQTAFDKSVYLVFSVAIFTAPTETDADFVGPAIPWRFQLKQINRKKLGSINVW